MESINRQTAMQYSHEITMQYELQRSFENATSTKPYFPECPTD